VESCYNVTGSGSLQICGFISSNASGFTCPTTYVLAGSCPSKTLVGCCVTTTTVSNFGTDAGSSEAQTGTCYYDATVAMVAESVCVGPAAKWVTTPP
jgi:hypothetical protein